MEFTKDNVLELIDMIKASIEANENISDVTAFYLSSLKERVEEMEPPIKYR